MRILEARGLTFSYKVDGRPVPVLRGVDLDVEEGEMLAIRGSSGSGKSTLLYILGCLLRADSGTLRIAGHDVSRLSNAELARARNENLGFVFQQFHLLPRASVVENILLPASYPCETAKVTPEKRARAEELARRLGLGEHLHHLPNQLSGGQQQRVAIARALMNDTKIIVADEPTGNLDSKNAAQIIEVLRELNRQGRTVIVVTHDTEVAKKCGREVHIVDGQFVGGATASDIGSRVSGSGSGQPSQNPESESDRMSGAGSEFRNGIPKTDPETRYPLTGAYLSSARALLPHAIDNLRRNKARSALTMLGITIGIAAVLAMITLGQFTKGKILESYESLGINRLNMNGHSNWKLKATDRVGVRFRSFDWKRDLVPLKTVFPQIRRLSPEQSAWGSTISFAGRQMSDGVTVFGVNEQYFDITNRVFTGGRGFSPYHVENRDPVCIIGADIAQQLFASVSPVGQITYITDRDSAAYSCKVIGVLKAVVTNNNWAKPNLSVYIPYTLFSLIIENHWQREIHEIELQIAPGHDVEQAGRGIRTYFEQKYGKSGRFRVDSDAILIAQMKKFLNLFAILLAAIAFISLLVGGIGIMNMMLVSVAERYKEIGLRKALGATDFNIRVQFLLESVVLCVFAGSVGLVGGFAAYQTLIYGASKLVAKLSFEWVIDPGALVISLFAILAVGIASGLVPAFRAERLEVIEALRSE